MIRNPWPTPMIYIGALLLTGCAGHLSTSVSPSPQGPSPPTTLMTSPLETPSPPAAAAATSHAAPPQREPRTDPLLEEALRLFQEATSQAGQGREGEAITLLTRARALFTTDGTSPPPETKTRRAELRGQIENLLEELITIQALTATLPPQEASSLVSPEDVQAIERAHPPTPEVLPPKPEIAFDVPIEMNAAVQAYIDLFTTTKRELIAAALERSGRYLPMMRQIFQEKGLPLDLVNLAYIESAFKLHAYSRAKAVGIWQFIKGTAKRYGLRTDWWVDERRDPEKATAAAADYLSDLYKMFESWPLAIASYNAGEWKVWRSTQRQKTTNFWKLDLPRETKLFVPAFMAMTIIAKDPTRYGFTPPTEQPWLVEQVTLPQPTDLRLIAKAANVSLEELKELNPELNRLITPPQQEYRINLPSGTKATFLDNFARSPQTQRVAWRQHQVRPGETLSTLAQRYRTSVAVLMEMNRLKSPHFIQAGSLLTVPVPTLTLAEIPQNTGGSPKGPAVDYVVQPGDNLWDIARAHNVSLHDLQRWNNLEGSLIHPGRTLRILSE